MKNNKQVSDTTNSFNLSNKYKNIAFGGATIVIMAISPEIMAATDELKDIAKGVQEIAAGSGMKIGMIVASITCIIAGLVNNAILKPMMALGGVAAVTPLFLKFIDTKYTILI